MPADEVRFDGVTKRFPGVAALDRVSFVIAAGSCHALCGENGAGKSTLGKLLAGIYTPDEGRIIISGEPVRFNSPTDALKSGVAMVHQELSFCENLSVAENLCLGSLPSSRGFVSRREMKRRAEAMLAPIDAALDVTRAVGTLTIGQQQMLQIASAIGQGARLIVFDEPTSSLSQHEAERLYALIGRLRERGVTCIYVSHRLEEIFRLCDTVTVLRDGHHVATRPVAEMDRAALVEMMIGRPARGLLPDARAGGARRGAPEGRRSRQPRRFCRRIVLVARGRSARFCRARRRRAFGSGTALFGLDRHSTGQRMGARPAGLVSERRTGDRARHRPRPGRPQAPGARALDGRAQQRHPVDPADASPGSASSRAEASGRSRSLTSSGCGSSRRGSTRRSPRCLAATSRRSS